jgi:NDP-sugar pyrophosphorylase family protein
VILAGGRGSRLAPYTTVLPKPLMPVGDRPILEILLGQLRAAGVEDVTLAVGHLAPLIEAVFGDGSRLGIRLTYHLEDEPLGTAGALARLDGLDETFLMLNGDVLTDLDVGAFVAAHRAAGSVLTIATVRRDVLVDYGVLHVEDGEDAVRAVSGYDEKPTLSYRVSTGVYLLEPEAVAHVPRDRHFDLPDLVLALLAAGRPVGSYAHHGYWLDIGRPDDFERAQQDVDIVVPRLEPT